MAIAERYADLVREQCAHNSAIINTGFLQSPEVQELLSHAGIFALPSSHEGLPISLLEAMRLGTPILASDIPANRETGLDDASYFPVGDTDTLSVRLHDLAEATPGELATIAHRERAACVRYDWDDIAQATMQVMKHVAGRSTPMPLNRIGPARPH